MKRRSAQIVAVVRSSLKAYVALAALMFIGGIVAGAALAIAGRPIPNPF